MPRRVRRIHRVQPEILVRFGDSNLFCQWLGWRIHAPEPTRRELEKRLLGRELLEPRPDSRQYLNYFFS